VYHDYQLSFGPLKTFYHERNRYLMLLKNLGWKTLFILSPILILMEIIVWGFVLLRDRQNIKNKKLAYSWIYHHKDKITEKRREIQRLRRISDRIVIAKMNGRIDFKQIDNGRVGKIAYFLFNPIFTALKALAEPLLPSK
jgi:hypothetical protein